MLGILILSFLLIIAAGNKIYVCIWIWFWFISDLRYREDKRDDVRYGEGHEVTVGGGMERPGDDDHHHHQQVAGDTNQEDGGLKDCPDETVQAAVILWVWTHCVFLSVQERGVPRLSKAVTRTIHDYLWAVLLELRSVESTRGDCSVRRLGGIWAARWETITASQK